jgi:hypothetical protein
MASIKINSQVNIGIDEILNGISMLETNEIEQFMQKISKIVAKRKANSLSTKESDLLSSINLGIPQKQQKRFELLSNKLNNRTISSKEHNEMLELIDILELKHAERLKNLIELSQLRNISLDSLMQELQLTIIPNASK